MPGRGRTLWHETARAEARDGGKAEREVPGIADAAEDRHEPIRVARRPLRAKAGRVKGRPHGTPDWQSSVRGILSNGSFLTHLPCRPE